MECVYPTLVHMCSVVDYIEMSIILHISVVMKAGWMTCFLILMYALLPTFSSTNTEQCRVFHEEGWCESEKQSHPGLRPAQ